MSGHTAVVSQNRSYFGASGFSATSFTLLELERQVVYHVVLCQIASCEQLRISTAFIAAFGWRATGIPTIAQDACGRYT